MAGFLRRKNKHADIVSAKDKDTISAPPPPAAQPAQTPLFARFATTQSGTYGEPSGGSRNVSSPMSLSGSVRRENTTGGSSYRGYGAASSSVSVATSGRSQASPQRQQPPPSNFYSDERSFQSRQSLEKPLPAPSPSPRVAGRGAPPVSLKQQTLRPRTSFTVPDDKPLPLPGGQAQYQPGPAPAVRRNLSLQTSFQPTPQAYTVTTNLLDDEFGDLTTPQAATPRVSMYRPGADFAGGYGGGGVAGVGSGYSAQERRISRNGGDLPPEFAMYQQLGDLSTSPQGSGGPPPPVAKPASSGGRSTSPSYNNPQHSKVAINSAPSTLSRPPSASPPLPTMGNSNSVLAASLYHSSIAPLPTRAFMDPRSVDVKQKVSHRRVGNSTPSPPPPPGASPPVVPPPSYVQEKAMPRRAPSNSRPPPSQAPASMPRGPRIFAAMAAADVEPEFAHVPPPNPSYSQQRPAQNGPIYPNDHQYNPAMSLPSPPSSNGYHNRRVSPPSIPPPVSNPYPTPPMQSEPLLAPMETSDPYAYDPTRTPRNFSRPLGSSGSIHRQSMVSSTSHASHSRASINPTPTPPQSPPKGRKLSKQRHQPAAADVAMKLSNGSLTSFVSASAESLHSSNHSHSGSSHGKLQVHQHGTHRTLAKTHQPAVSSNLNNSLPSTPQTPASPPSPADMPVMQANEEVARSVGIPLDDDPFAKAEGVKMLSPIAAGDLNGAMPVAVANVAPVATDAAVKRSKSGMGDDLASAPAADITPSAEQIEAVVEAAAQGELQSIPPEPIPESPKKTKEQLKEERRRERKERKAREKEAKVKEKERQLKEKEAALTAAGGVVPPRDRPQSLVDEPEPLEEKVDTTSFPLARFVSDPHLLGNLLSYFSFYDWCVLSSVTREVRMVLVQSKELREEVLERYLQTVGYARWAWDDKEPLSLSLQDLADYMRGVSTPSHEYARVAKMYVHSLSMHPDIRDPSLEHTVHSLTASTRAYTRVVLRLRAQAEKEASIAASNPLNRATPPSASIRNGVSNYSNNGYANGYIPSRPASRSTSRAPSPTMSSYSHSQSNMHSYPGPTSSQSNKGFHSPLFRLRRAPLLRVFVPSPEGDWLSDRSVLECEEECKRAGVTHLMRMGDVVWDIAVGDEGNVGRMVYDGKYLIDLDYTFNPIGDLPKYIPALAFPPSYFHRVIRTGAVTSNPVVHMDISPWGEEIAANLQLLQDRVKTETPQGAYHNVVRWVHRSSFVIRPPARVMQRGPSVNGRGQPSTPRIPIPDTENLFIDSGWYGTIVVETEGTNEALADLQDRCGPRAFPPRPRPMNPAQQKAHAEVRKVFRILREKSRPGEIWIKAVGVKERIL